MRLPLRPDISTFEKITYALGTTLVQLPPSGQDRSPKTDPGMLVVQVEAVMFPTRTADAEPPGDPPLLPHGGAPGEGGGRPRRCGIPAHGG